MKLSYPIATPESDVSIKAFTGDFEENVAYVSRYGYEAVELLVREPKLLDKKEIKEILEHYSLEVAAVGTSPMQVQDHLFLLHPNELNRREAYARCLDLVEFSAYFNAPMVIGKYRGNIDDKEGCRKEDFNKIVKDISLKAREEGIKVLIEPQNPEDINFINTIEEAAAWIGMMNLENIGLLIDTYHMGFTEESITKSINKYQKYIGFVHLADHDRRIPGTGKLDMEAILRELKNIKYEAYLSVEIEQYPNSQIASQLTKEVLHYLDKWKK